MDTNAPGWQPPHCPNPNCNYHNHVDGPWPYKKHGFHYRRITPHRIQRFTCKSCGRSFSSQTFSTTYWLKRPEILEKLMMKDAGGMANRQIARDLEAAPSTIDRQLSRLGRHCLLFHAKMTEGADPPDEIAFDGFVTFELSQYYPTHFHVCVEPKTSFFNHFTDSEVRRSGKMTDRQKSKRRMNETMYGRPDPQAVKNDVRELLREVTKGAAKLKIKSDKHRAYPIVIGELDCEVDHEVVSSEEPRDRGSLLWEINRLDRMIRHSQAGHARETLAWPKRRQRAAERLSIFLVWWNYVKKRWEKGKHRTPSELKGVVSRRLTVKEILAGRIFRTRQRLSRRWSEYYESKIRTRALRQNNEHELRYAF